MEPLSDASGTSETGTSETGTSETGVAVSGTVTVRYWASARAAAGVASDAVPVEGPVTLADLRERAVSLHPGTNLDAVLGVCSVLVGEQPVGSQDPGSVAVAPGSTVEFLPPFAGG